MNDNAQQRAERIVAASATRVSGPVEIRICDERKELDAREERRRLLAEEALHRSEARLVTIIEQSPTSIQSFAPDGSSLGANGAWEELWQCDRAQLKGYNILRDEQLKTRGAMPQVERAFNGEARRIPSLLYDPRDSGMSGRARWVDASIYPVRDQLGNVAEVVLMLQDVTERKIIEVERASLLSRERFARAEAESANRAKDEFLAVVSHELRTPLTPMLGWTRLLLNRKLDEAGGRRALEIIERNVRAQSQVVEDLLDISRIISGKMKLNVGPVNLATVIENAIETVSTALESKRLTVEKRLDPAASFVSGDPDRLRQVIWNLLSNAIKFTPASGTIRIALQQVNAQIEIVVQDNGEGIAPEFLTKIFKRFSQADSTSSRKHGGLGLGLAIVRHIVELHGGTIRAESAGKGHGARFTVTLPPRNTALEDRESKFEYRARRTDQMQELLRGLRILAVDDEPDTRDMVAAVLEQWGAQVATAGSVDEALVAIESLRPDVLITDIGMPGRDGFELIRKIRDSAPPQCRDMPAIALTAFARAEDRVRVLSEGFQMHIPKPVDPAELATAVAHVAGRKR